MSSKSSKNNKLPYLEPLSSDCDSTTTLQTEDEATPNPPPKKKIKPGKRKTNDSIQPVSTNTSFLKGKIETYDQKGHESFWPFVEDKLLKNWVKTDGDKFRFETAKTDPIVTYNGVARSTVKVQFYETNVKIMTSQFRNFLEFFTKTPGITELVKTLEKIGNNPDHVADEVTIMTLKSVANSQDKFIYPSSSTGLIKWPSKICELLAEQYLKQSGFEETFEKQWQESKQSDLATKVQIKTLFTNKCKKNFKFSSFFQTNRTHEFSMLPNLDGNLLELLFNSGINPEMFVLSPDEIKKSEAKSKNIKLYPKYPRSDFSFRSEDGQIFFSIDCKSIFWNPKEKIWHDINNLQNLGGMVNGKITLNAKSCYISHIISNNSDLTATSSAFLPSSKDNPVQIIAEVVDDPLNSSQTNVIDSSFQTAENGSVTGDMGGKTPAVNELDEEDTSKNTPVVESGKNNSDMMDEENTGKEKPEEEENEENKNSMVVENA